MIRVSELVDWLAYMGEDEFVAIDPETMSLLYLGEDKQVLAGLKIGGVKEEADEEVGS